MSLSPHPVGAGCSLQGCPRSCPQRSNSGVNAVYSTLLPVRPQIVSPVHVLAGSGGLHIAPGLFGLDFLPCLLLSGTCHRLSVPGAASCTFTLKPQISTLLRASAALCAHPKRSHVHHAVTLTQSAPPHPHITPGATNPPLHPPQVPSTTTTTTCSGSRDPPGGFALVGRAAQRLPRHHFQLPNVTPPICSSSLTEGPMAFVPLWDGGTSLVKADHGGL